MKKIIVALILGMSVLALTGCTKKVENKKLSITVFEKQITGTYSGETEDNQASGIGIFEDNDSLSIDGEFQDGKLVSGTVKNFPYTLNLNNQDYNGLYSGSYDNGANGKGEFVLQSDSSKILLEGEFKEDILKSGKVSEFPITCEITGISYNGKYTGEITNGEVTGEGEFTAGGIDYIGAFKNGELIGEGELRNSTYVVDFWDVSRKGKYDGKLIDGKADGTGTFTAKNADGIKYTYEGQWKSGLYNGSGNLIYNSKDSYKQEGTFKDGEFTPTVKECFIALGTYSKELYSIGDNSQKFIDSNEKLFTKQQTSSIYKAAKRATDNSISYKKYINNKDKYGDKLMKITGQVIHITHEQAWLYPQTNILVTDSDGNIYYVTFLKKITKIKNEDSVTIYALPLDYCTYESVTKTSIWSIRMAGVYIK